MKKLLFLFIIFLFISCSSNHPGEPVIVKKKFSNNDKEGKYYYTVKMGYGHETFWSDKDYELGDTLTKCQ